MALAYLPRSTVVRRFILLREIALALLDKVMVAMPDLKLDELALTGPPVTIANSALGKSEVLAGGVSDRQDGGAKQASALDEFFANLTTDGDSKAVN